MTTKQRIRLSVALYWVVIAFLLASGVLGAGYAATQSVEYAFCQTPASGCQTLLQGNCTSFLGCTFDNATRTCLTKLNCANAIRSAECGIKGIMYEKSASLLPACIRGNIDECDAQRQYVYNAFELETECEDTRGNVPCSQGGCTVPLDTKTYEENRFHVSIEYYVSPVAGRDSISLSGRRTEPFRTIQYALERSRSNEGVKRSIVLMAGTHRLVKPITLTPRDSKLTIRGEDGAIVSGAVQVRGLQWAPSTRDPSILVARIPDVIASQIHTLSALFINDEPAIRARYPNLGHFFDTAYANKNLIKSWRRRTQRGPLSDVFGVTIQQGYFNKFYSARGGSCEGILEPPVGYFCNPKHMAHGGCPFHVPAGVDIDAKTAQELKVAQWSLPRTHMHVFHPLLWGLWVFDLNAAGQTFTSRPSPAVTQEPTTLAPLTSQPSQTPTTSRPSRAPTTSRPSTSPRTSLPSKTPSTSVPSRSPSRGPTRRPTTGAPSKTPSTSQPSKSPTFRPTQSPTTSVPSKSPSTSRPSSAPSTSRPSRSPTASPSTSPIINPTTSPSSSRPTTSPTNAPSGSPSKRPSSSQPSQAPVTSAPSFAPSTSMPTSRPSAAPSGSPTLQPSQAPTPTIPTRRPVSVPTRPTTRSPTLRPSRNPTMTLPTRSPTVRPSKAPSYGRPSLNPTMTRPTRSPTVRPSKAPSTGRPSLNPTMTRPTLSPRARATFTPTLERTNRPSLNPTMRATKSPTFTPTKRVATLRPSRGPTMTRPSRSPSLFPTKRPTTGRPSRSPEMSRPTRSPTGKVTPLPTSRPPTNSPSAARTTTPTSARPSKTPIASPTAQTASPTSARPSSHPTGPSLPPTLSPTVPVPVSNAPSSSPTRTPTARPTSEAPTVTASPTANEYEAADDSPTGGRGRDLQGSVTLGFGRGGFQEARGDCQQGGSSWFVENAIPLLDSRNEFYIDLDDPAGVFLYYMPNVTNVREPSTVIELSVTRVLFQALGTSENPVSDVNFVNMQLEKTYPTHMDSHESPSGGDWTVHRQGAILLEGVIRAEVYGNFFRHLGGNGAFVSNYARDVAIRRNKFYALAASAILLVGNPLFGHARPFDRTTNQEHVERVLVSENVASDFGIVIKQSAGVFMALSRSVRIERNVIFNCPRAGILFNDGFGGNTTVEHNIVFNTVRETYDHGPFNSWDRQRWLQNPEVNPSLYPFRIVNNFMMGSGLGYKGIDLDDGAMHYVVEGNVVFDSFQKFKGANVKVRRNLFYPHRASGSCTFVTPFNFQPANFLLEGNTCILRHNWPIVTYNGPPSALRQLCKPQNFMSRGNRYYGPSATTASWRGCGSPRVTWTEYRTKHRQEVGSTAVGSLPSVPDQLRMVAELMDW